MKNNFIVLYSKLDAKNEKTGKFLVEDVHGFVN